MASLYRTLGQRLRSFTKASILAQMLFFQTAHAHSTYPDMRADTVPDMFTCATFVHLSVSVCVLSLKQKEKFVGTTRALPPSSSALRGQVQNFEGII